MQGWDESLPAPFSAGGFFSWSFPRGVYSKKKKADAALPLENSASASVSASRD
jgi:hypothetical protein